MITAYTWTSPKAYVSCLICNGLRLTFGRFPDYQISGGPPRTQSVHSKEEASEVLQIWRERDNTASWKDKPMKEVRKMDVTWSLIGRTSATSRQVMIFIMIDQHDTSDAPEVGAGAPEVIINDTIGLLGRCIAPKTPPTLLIHETTIAADTKDRVVLKVGHTPQHCTSFVSAAQSRGRVLLSRKYPGSW